MCNDKIAGLMVIQANSVSIMEKNIAWIIC